MAEKREFVWNRLSTHLNVRVALGVLAAVALAGALGGYLVGTSRSGISIYTGKAHSTTLQISLIGEDGWVYDVPLDVHWTDAGGTWHEGDRPKCLPPDGDLPAPVTFAATQVTVNGMTWRPVVWVSCAN